MADFPVAYCGPAPAPAALATAWTFDPAALAGIAALALAALVWGRSRWGLGAAAVMAILLVSPLCALGGALYAGRALHHALTMGLAAPLLALAFPSVRAPGPAGLWFAAHAATLWVWHAPGPYDWAVATPEGFWAMQASMLGTAWGFWACVLRPGARLEAALLLVGMAAQMGLLAALIVFAPAPLHVAHLATAPAWGFSSLADQQLAGLLMWAPASLPYLAAALAIAWRAGGSAMRTRAP